MEQMAAAGLRNQEERQNKDQRFEVLHKDGCSLYNVTRSFLKSGFIAHSDMLHHYHLAGTQLHQSPS